MLEKIKDWSGAVEINSTTFENYEAISSELNLDSNTVIVLHSKKEQSASQSSAASGAEYVVTVRQYMTKKASPSFDFMAKMNNDVPMPLRTMVGVIDKETPGMYHMILHGDIIAKQISVCMKCGKSITNPVSQYFGMGPECGGHNYVNPFGSQAELDEAVSNYKEQLQNITWSGWVIKSAITNIKEKED